MNPKSNTHKKNNIYIYLIIISTIFFAKEGDPSDSKDNNKTSGIHLPIYLFNHSFTLSFIHSFIHSFIQSFIHSFTHSFIHSFFSLHFIDSWFITFFTGNALCTHPQQHSKKPPQRLGGISENKSDIILIENIAFNYLLINYFSLGHQVSPLKPLLD
jgi:hypothetical protein